MPHVGIQLVNELSTEGVKGWPIHLNNPILAVTEGDDAGDLNGFDGDDGAYAEPADALPDAPAGTNDNDAGDGGGEPLQDAAAAAVDPDADMAATTDGDAVNGDAADAAEAPDDDDGLYGRWPSFAALAPG